ncbi:unnamed protein product [Cuscuta europaea]|uniref:DUF659 domain-containing protein n=1 Tax=Cuscuta europaea TaxID=41803 RepID=A0A9P1EDE8_CUSEU|nr:unnamed protein product [Cuscuta europaea]
MKEVLDAKNQRKESLKENSLGPDFDDDDVEEIECEDGTSKTSTIKGPMNLYFKSVSKEHQKLKRARGVEVTLATCKKELREKAVTAFARWMYEAGLPFNCVNYKTLQSFIDAVAQHGPCMKAPTYHEVRVPYLKKEVDHVKELFKPHEDICNQYGCSLMMDKWTDRRNRAYINVLVNCSLGSYFIQSVEVSLDTVNGEKMLELFELFVNRVGSENVVQVISDNASETQFKRERKSGNFQVQVQGKSLHP